MTTTHTQRQREHLATAKQHRATAASHEASAAAEDRLIEVARGKQDTARAAHAEQTDRILCDGPMPALNELAAVVVPMLEDRIAAAFQSKARHVAARDAALAAARDAEQAAAAAFAEHVEGEVAPALAAAVTARANYIKAYRAAHGETPPKLPGSDLNALAERAANEPANDDEDDEPKRGLLSIFRR